MRFGYTIVYVPDVKMAMDFYEEAFGLKQRFLHESGQYGEMETGSTALAFADEAFVRTFQSFRSNRASDTAPGLEIAFVADDVEAAFKHACEKGATEVVAPEAKPWGQVVSYVRDLNGILVEICSQVA